MFLSAIFGIHKTIYKYLIRDMRFSHTVNVKWIASNELATVLTLIHIFIGIFTTLKNILTNLNLSLSLCLLLRLSHTLEIVYF